MPVRKNHIISAVDEATIFRLAIEQMAQGLFMLDAKQRIIVLNKQFLDIYNLPADKINVGASAYDIVEQSVLAGNYPGRAVADAWEAASARLAAKQPWRIQQKLGNGKIVAISYSPITEGGWVTTHLDVTDRQRAEDRLAYLALHDELTGAANRSFFLQTLEQYLSAGSPITVLCLDLDRFKSVNDTYGHASGDDLLKQVVERLRTCIRTSDMLARLGGDEFAIILSDRIGVQQIDMIAKRMIQALGMPFDLSGHRVQIGASIGIEFSTSNEVDGKNLMKRADNALYRAKIEGRGTYRYVDSQAGSRH